MASALCHWRVRLPASGVEKRLPTLFFPYGYDLDGNRNTTGYTTTTGNRLTSDGTYNYTFDNEGNVLTKTRISDSQRWEFTWDYRNRLTNVKIKNAGGAVILEDRFTYDVWDHRIGKWVDADGAGPNPGVQSWTAYGGPKGAGCGCSSCGAQPNRRAATTPTPTSTARAL